MIKHAYYNYDIGIIKIGYNDKAIVTLGWADKKDSENEQSELSDLAFSELSEYFQGVRKYFNISIELNGTDFQKKVWDALLQIPYGETRTYGQIAKAVGNPKACRAVGMANNKNPIAIIVPCHRVIGANGKLVGYAGGLNIKKVLLEIEKNNQ